MAGQVYGRVANSLQNTLGTNMVTSSAAALASGIWDHYSLAQKKGAIALELESIIAF